LVCASSGSALLKWLAGWPKKREQQASNQGRGKKSVLYSFEMFNSKRPRIGRGEVSGQSKQKEGLEHRSVLELRLEIEI
jgi:hypothetical protein